MVKGSQLWGRPATDLRALREDVAEGVFFSIAGSAATIYNDIDKIMLSRLADLAATGVYAAAYRVIDVSMTPVRSLAAAAYPQFFRKGTAGMAATYPYARSLIAKTSLYGLLASAGLWCWHRFCPTFWEPDTRRWFRRSAGWRSFPCCAASIPSWQMRFPAPDMQRTRTGIQVACRLGQHRSATW